MFLQVCGKYVVEKSLTQNDSSFCNESENNLAFWRLVGLLNECPQEPSFETNLSVVSYNPGPEHPCYGLNCFP